MPGETEIEGFSVPFHNSLAEPMMFGGVPRTFAILNGVFAAEMCLGLQVPLLGIPLAFGLHTLAYALHKGDPHFFSVLMRHIRQKPYWEA